MGKTKDDVPPRGLFGNNPSGNLITVPACVKCNNDTSNDDELFRLIALENNAAEHPAAKDVAEATYRALFHPKKEGFKRFVFDRIEPTGPIPEGDVDPKTMVPGTMTLPLRAHTPDRPENDQGPVLQDQGRTSAVRVRGRSLPHGDARREPAGTGVEGFAWRRSRPARPARCRGWRGGVPISDLFHRGRPE